MTQLRIPGPTPLPPEARRAAGRQMIGHKSAEFRDMFLRITENLKKILETENDVLLFTSSGMGGLEAAVVNLFSPKDKVILFSIGEFGDRFADVCTAYGLNLLKIRFPAGKAADVQSVERALKEHPNAKAILIQHNETSTGVTNDVAAIASVVKRAKKLFIVDAVSSLGAIPLKTDEWGIDVVISASQKALMAPPGIALASVSREAWEAHKRATLPRYYFDFSLAKEFAVKGFTHATPSVSTLFALNVTTPMIVKEGMKKIFARHERIAAIARDSLKRSGFRLLADKECASATVTAAMLPEGMEEHTSAFIKLMKEKYRIIVASGQGELQGKIFRVAHMGFVNEREIRAAGKALDEGLKVLQKTK